MKKVLTLGLLALLMGQSQAADLSNQECIEVYRDGYVMLREAVTDYNDKGLSRGEFAAQVTAIGTEVKALRFACFLTESPSVSSCVEKYEDIYSDLRSKIRVRSVLSGNQDSINITNSSSQSNGFFNRLRNRGSDTLKQGKLALIDAKCL
ncbi:MAG: hypothetical protein VXV96_06150 [Bdellovibrionota bacterium]|nr:hypothetical protein [Bdellovibrionota bacterium]